MTPETRVPPSLVDEAYRSLVDHKCQEYGAAIRGARPNGTTVVKWDFIPGDLPEPVRNALASMLDQIERDERLIYRFATGRDAWSSPIGLRRLKELVESGALGPSDRLRVDGAHRPTYVCALFPQAFNVAGYALHDVLGEGGMGTVYKAWDPKPLRYVALKTIRPSAHDTLAIEWFRYEAQDIARLRHPNIVQVYRVDEHDGHPFFVMEYVEGNSLARSKAAYELWTMTPQPLTKAAPGTEESQGKPKPTSRRSRSSAMSMLAHVGRSAAAYVLPRLDPEGGVDTQGVAHTADEVAGRIKAIAQLMSTLAMAVHHAHLRGIVHRDLKPANVLLGEDEVPKVTDFGVAKRIGNDPGRRDAGAVVGTANYMAPEQADPGGADVGPPSDVYGLGAILFELLTGKPPFEGPSSNEVLQKVKKETPPPPSRLNPAVPRDLEAICLRCMQRDPAQRYGSAREVADDLTRFMERRPIEARRTGRVERLRLWKRRHPGMARLSALSATVAVVAIVMFAAWRTSVASRRAAEMQVQVRALQRDFAEAGTALSQLQQLDRGQGNGSSWEKAKAEASRFVTLRREFDEGVRALGGPTRAIALLGTPSWNQLGQQVRNELGPWLTGLRLSKQSSLRLPAQPDRSVMPSVAIRSENGMIAEIAVLVPGAPEVMILDPNGKERARLQVPDDMARRAKVVSATTRRRSLNALESRLATELHASRFTYTELGELEYQVEEQLVTWSPETRERKRDVLPAHRPPHPRARLTNAAGNRYTASADEQRVTVTLRPWHGQSRPMAIWHAAGGDPAGGGERIDQIAFGIDGRSLFILTNLRLAVVDCETNAVADVPLGDFTGSFDRELIPCAGGVALTELLRERDSAEAASVTFWHVALPQTHVQVLRPDAQARCVSAESFKGGTLVAVGASDHTLTAWNGTSPMWQAGIPYLGQKDGQRREGDRRPKRTTASPNRPIVSQHTRQNGAAGDPRSKRYVVEESEPAPRPYLSWLFPGARADRFLVQRLETESNGAAAVLTEVYAIHPSAKGLEARVDRTFSERRGSPLLAVDPHGTIALSLSRDDGNDVLEIVSLADGKRVGLLAGSALASNANSERWGALKAEFVEGRVRTDYLLLARRVSGAPAAEVEVWRVSGAPTLVGRFSQPDIFAYAFLLNEEGRAMLWRPSGTGQGVFFAEVVDLPSARVVCRLQGFETTGTIRHSLMAGPHFVYVCHQGLADDANDPYRSYVWDLNTGEQWPLDTVAWGTASLPEIEFSPDRQHVAIAGNLHETAEAYVRIYDLQKRAPVAPAFTRPWPARPHLPTVSDTYCAVDLDDHPSKGKLSRVRLSWEGATEVAAAPAEVLLAQRSLDGSTGWLLWRDRQGLLLQNGYGGARIRLSNSSSLADDEQLFLRQTDTVEWPPTGVHTVALLTPGGGIWRTDTGDRVLVYPPGHECLGLDDQRRWALTIEAGTGQITIWDAATGRAVRRCVPRGAEGPPFELEARQWQLSPDGRCLAVMWQGVLRLWDLDANEPFLIVPKAGHSAAVACVAQSAATGLVASGDEEGLVFLWHRADGRLFKTLLAHRDAVTALAFQPDGKRLVSASAGGSVVAWDSRGNPTWRLKAAPATRITSLAFHPAKPRLVAGTADGRVLIIEAASGKLLSTLAGTLGPVKAVAFSPPGDALAVATDLGVQLWSDLDRPPQAWRTGSPITALAFAKDRSLLLTGGQTACVWNVETHERLWELPVSRGPVQQLVLEPLTGELVVVDGNANVSVLALGDLHGRLMALELGLPELSRLAWPTDPPTVPVEPPGRSDWTRLADEFYSRRQWTPLVWACTSALARWPDEARLWAYLGMASARDPQSWQSARMAYSRALDLDPKDTRIWVLRGDLYQRVALSSLGEREASPLITSWLRAAYDDYGSAIEKGLKDRSVLQKRGLIAAQLGEFQAAERDLNRALAGGRADARALRVRGNVRAELENWQAAAQDLRTASQLAPSDAASLREYAAVLLNQGDDASFRTLRSLMLDRFGDSYDPATCALVAWTCALAPLTPAEAEACVRLATRALSAPDQPIAWRALGAALYRAGRYQEAVNQLTANLQRPGVASPQASIFLALAQRRAGLSSQPDSARQAADQLEKDPHGRMPWFQRVELRVLRTQLDDPSG